ncbi:MFS transporter [Streptomyces sioyaensis]|uniref:MFS transporter n=1 Tax=Streptomyces sioyaensis TaxID=67364 RepID=UPI0037D3BDC8
MTGTRTEDVEYDPVEDGSGRGIFDGEHRTLTASILTLAVLVGFDAMALTTVIPVVVAELDGVKLYAWSFSAFIIGSLLATIVGGEAADRAGPTGPFVVGVALFVGGLVCAGLAPSMTIFILGRALQGIGGSAFFVALNVLVGHAYPKRLVPRAVAAMSGAWVLPAMVGPIVAGTVADRVGWRAVFLALVPLALVALAAVLPRMRRLPKAQAAPSRPWRKYYALAAAVGVGLVQFSMQHLEWWSIAVLLAGGLLLALGLPRLLPTGTLRLAAGMPRVVGLRFFFAAAYFGVQTYLPLMLTGHRGLSVTAAGLALTVGSLGWSTGAWLQGRDGTRLTRTAMVRIGMVLVVAAGAMSAVVAFKAVPVWLVGLACALGGVGMGLGRSTLSALVLTGSAPGSRGSNTASAQLAESLGQVLSIGVGGAVIAALGGADGAGGTAFLLVFPAMALVGLLSLGFARRVSPAAPVDG